MGQKSAQATERNDRAQFCGCQTASRASLCPFPRVAERADTVPVGGHCTKYQEDSVTGGDALLVLSEAPRWIYGQTSNPVREKGK